jgi:hypothetical protein
MKRIVSGDSGRRALGLQSLVESCSKGRMQSMSEVLMRPPSAP